MGRSRTLVRPVGGFRNALRMEPTVAPRSAPLGGGESPEVHCRVEGGQGAGNGQSLASDLHREGRAQTYLRGKTTLFPDGVRSSAAALPGEKASALLLRTRARSPHQLGKAAKWTRPWPGIRKVLFSEQRWDLN